MATVQMQPRSGGDAGTLSFGIVGLDCAGCAAGLDRAVRALSGVDEVRTDLLEARITVDYDPERLTESAVRAAIRRAGFGVREIAPAPVRSYRIEGLCCTTESSRIASRLAGRSDVSHLDFDYLGRELTITGPIPPEQVRRVIEHLGMRVEASGEAETAAPQSARSRLLFLLAGAFFWSGAFLGQTVLGAPSLTRIFAFLAILTGGRYILPQGVRAARALALDMNALMSIAALGALLIGESLEAASAMVLFALAQLLEARSLDSARAAIGALMELAPATAAVLRAGAEVRIPAEEVEIGERVVVRPGEKIPIDGEIVAGSSLVDQAMVTGESMPVSRSPGDPVHAGTLNGEGVLEIRSTRAADETTLARIIHSVREAQALRAPSQQFVDRFARIYTPGVVIAAFALFCLPPLLGFGAWALWFHRALVLLVIACPCALVISTPVTIVSALTGAARRGMLVRGGTHLEQLARTRAIAFDKTGTLTRGEPVVTRIELREGVARELLLARIAGIEAQSGHPLAHAVIEYTRREGIEPVWPADVRAIPGKGIEGRSGAETFLIGSERLFLDAGADPVELRPWLGRSQNEGSTIVLIGARRRDAGPVQIQGAIRIADRVRPETAGALAELHRLGLDRVAMLTGDHPAAARDVADSLGIQEIRAELLPHDKVHALRDLRERWGPVIFVGDGINDAPVLATAEVGVAIGSGGSDVALESADIVLMGADLGKLPLLIRLARKAQGIIRANIILALLTKAIFLILALSGFATLWMAVAADLGTSLLVTVNGMRTMRI